MSQVITPLITCPRNAQWGILLHWVGLGHFDAPKFPDFFWYHRTRRELLYTYYACKVIKQTRGRWYTITNYFLMVFQSKCIRHACPAGIFVMDKKYSKCSQTS